MPKNIEFLTIMDDLWLRKGNKIDDFTFWVQFGHGGGLEGVFAQSSLHFSVTQ
jgi:hypothetical protein